MAPINIAVIGCGYWGPNLIRNFNFIPDCEMKVCCDINIERLKRMKQLYPDIEITTNYKEISKNCFGDNHVITKLAKNITTFFPNIVYPVAGWLPPKKIPPIEIVQGFDSSSTNNYIT